MIDALMHLLVSSGLVFLHATSGVTTSSGEAGAASSSNGPASSGKPKDDAPEFASVSTIRTEKLDSAPDRKQNQTSGEATKFEDNAAAISAENMTVEDFNGF